MRIMVVEDEKKVLSFLKKGLTSADITVDTATNMDEAFTNLLSNSYDVIILDRLLEGVDAVRYIAEIKKKHPKTKILVLSALSEVDEKIRGLSEGADDYLGKPFHISELMARIMALTRRDTSAKEGSNVLVFEDVTIKLDSQKVTRGDTRIDLTPKEYKLLVFLIGNPNKVFSKTDIVSNVWELQYYPESNVVEVVVNHLRNKVDKGFTKPLIHSRRGIGYWLGNPNL